MIVPAYVVKAIKKSLAAQLFFKFLSIHSWDFSAHGIGKSAFANSDPSPIIFNHTDPGPFGSVVTVLIAVLGTENVFPYVPLNFKKSSSRVKILPDKKPPGLNSNFKTKSLLKLVYLIIGGIAVNC
jgi:hypothetical protein